MKIILIGITSNISEVAAALNRNEMFSAAPINSFCGFGNQYISSEIYLKFLGFNFSELDLNEIDYNLVYNKLIYYNYEYFKDYYYIYNNETISEVISRLYYNRYKSLPINVERLNYCYEIYFKLKKIWDLFFRGIGERYLLKINFNNIDNNLLNRYLNNNITLSLKSIENREISKFVKYRGYL